MPPRVSHVKPLSRIPRPVDTGFERPVSSSCKAWAAETDAGPSDSFSELPFCVRMYEEDDWAASRIHQTGWHGRGASEVADLPLAGMAKLEISCPWIA